MLAALFIGVGWCVLAYYSQVSAAKQAPAPAAGVREDMDPLPGIRFRRKSYSAKPGTALRL